MSGFIRLERNAFDHPMLKDPARFYAWFWMVARACWKPVPFDIAGTIVTLERGQLCASVRQLANDWQWSKSAVDRFLSRLEAERMIEREAGHGKCVITICNYEKYQSLENSQRDSSGTGNRAEFHPNATRTQPDQKAGQHQGASNPQKTESFEHSDTGLRDSSGTAAGQQRDIKEQGNKVTIEEPNGSSPPIVPQSKTAFSKPDWADQQVWTDFLANRKRKKLANTVTAYRRFLSDIAKLSDDEWPPGRLLEEIVARGWAAAYDPRPKDRRNDRQPENHQQRDHRDGLSRMLDEELGIDNPC